MKSETFFETVDQLMDAPGAPAQVRKLVLQLAMRGKLVPQYRSEGDAQAVLERIERTGKKLDRVQLMGLPKTSGSNVQDWYSIPPSWRWTRLDALGKIVGGGTPRSDNPKYFAEDGIPWLTPADLNGFKGKRIQGGRRFITKAGLENSSAQLLPAGTVLFSSRAPIGYVAIAGRDLATNQGFKSCIPYVEETAEFLYYFLLSAAARIDREASGTTFREVSGKIVGQISVPLPPLAEQKRIVDKVDELMALCDRLEEQQREREVRHSALTHATVTRFNEAPTAANLNFLFHESYSISATDLRKTIANLALRGKLVSKDDGFESVDVLLTHLLDERHAYSTKYGFRTNDLSRNKVDARYQIPTHWRWVNLSELFYAVTDGDHLPPPKSSDGIAFLTIGNITTGQLDFSEVRYVPKHYYDALAEYRQPRKGDFLYTVVGATYGRPAPVDTTRPFCVQRHIAILKPCQSTNRAFLSLLLKSPLVYEQAKASTTGTAQPTIPLGALRRFQVPLPPLSEQDRIARKVSELIALVDTMDEQLRRTEATSKELLDACIHLVLHPDKEVANNHKHDSASARAAIGCYAIRSLTQNASFGRTMLMKVFYLSEAHSGISQGWQPMRQAAGPYDPAIEDFESLGVQSGWFTVKTKTLGNGHEMVQYQRKSGIDAKIAEAVSVLGGQQTEFDRLLNLFQNKTTEEAEIIATLFAAWNDLLIDGKSPSDDEIIREVRENWHYKKERFTPTLLTRWLNWLRQQSVIPRGLAPRTRQQLKLGLS